MKSKNQPEVNVGMVGHVDHGKTTLTQQLTGEWTDRHSEEIKRGISIKLGYADATFYKCKSCKEPECYSIKPECSQCGGKCEETRAVSIVDSPGHETLMATMLAGTALMNGAILLVAANEICPQPQTIEHLMALEISNVKNIIIVQNKIDLVSDEQLMKNYEQIKNFTQGTVAEDSPVIPVCAHQEANIDTLIQAIETRIPTHKFDTDLPLRMFVARSFDVNKPGTVPKSLRGGVIGGSILHGTLSKGEDIEIAPWIKEGKAWVNLVTEATSVISGGMERNCIKPGGLVAIGTMLDPSMTKSDGMLGKVVGKVGTLPPIWEDMTINIHPIKRVVGLASNEEIDRIKPKEPLMLNIGAATTVGIVQSFVDDVCDVKIRMPVCASEDQRVAVSRKVKNRWHLVGWGSFK